MKLAISLALMSLTASALLAAGQPPPPKCPGAIDSREFDCTVGGEVNYNLGHAASVVYQAARNCRVIITEFPKCDRRANWEAKEKRLLELYAIRKAEEDKKAKECSSWEVLKTATGALCLSGWNQSESGYKKYTGQKKASQKEKSDYSNTVSSAKGACNIAKAFCNGHAAAGTIGKMNAAMDQWRTEVNALKER